jgi:GNAT superfamily N-acetyltransferase
MSSYRFCRTDDIGLLVDALNRCRTPAAPGEPPMTPAAFKRSIRDLQVWCSSCMVAFAGSDPIGVLIGAKRPHATLVHTIAVHPEHQGQGHAGHLLQSLSSKLAILGPPRIVAEVPETFEEACRLFRASGYVEETVLTDYVSDGPSPPPREMTGTFVIPVTLDDLAANGLLEAQDARTSWERSPETLNARKDAVSGLALASDEQIEAYLLYMRREDPLEGEVLLFRSRVDDGGARLAHLIACARRAGLERLRLPKAHPEEIPAELLEAIGFRPAGRHRLFATTARAH